MNISKNILSLGLIAVISGVSTAQTYTGTAGTNGVTDIQSDYSMSTGDGASVSVDVPLEFELPKKVAIFAGNTIPVNGLFDGLTWAHSPRTSLILNTEPLSATYSNLSKNRLYTVGGIYANTAVSVTAEATDFIHEIDPNSSFIGRKDFRVGKMNTTNAQTGYAYGRIVDANNGDPNVSLFPATINLDETALATEGNKFTWFFDSYVYLSTIDTTDRAGKYTSTLTVTVNTL